MKRILQTTFAALACVWSLGAAAQPVQGLIVMLKPAAQSGREQPQEARERVLAVAQSTGVGVQSQSAISGRLHLLRTPAPLQGEGLDAAMRRLRLHPDVEFVEPDVRVKRLAVPNDPLFSQQWHLMTPAVSPGGINMPPAWDLSTGTTGPGAPVVIATLDTGVRFAHPDLAGRLLPGYDFVSEVDFANDGDGRDADASDPGDWVSAADRQSNPAIFGSCGVEDSSWHGTFIAGLIAAASNNAVGVSGVNWGARILPVRVFGKCGALVSDILEGMRWAAGLSVAGAPANPTPARVINLSFGGDAACTASYQNVIDEVTAAGVLVVAAAGNEGAQLRRPADCRNVLAVGAVQNNGQKATYSNVGAGMGLMAPGGTSSQPLISADNDGLRSPGVDSYGGKLGTSFSAPLAAAVASLMLTVNPTLTPAQLIAQLRASARAHVTIAGGPTCTSGITVPCNCTTALCGAGLLDAQSAVSSVLPGGAPTAAIAPVNDAVGGTTVTLDGRNSIAGSGRSIVSYEWRQVSGPEVAIQNAAASVATVQLPGTGATFVFELRVTDSSGASAAATVTVASTSAPSSGGGGGSMSLFWGLGLWSLALLALVGRGRRRAAASR
jgi:serine protease